MKYVYKVFFGSPDQQRENPDPALWVKMVQTSQIVAGNSSALPHAGVLWTDPKIAYKTLHAVQAQRAFMLVASIGAEGVDLLFLHGTQFLRDSRMVFPVIIEVSESQTDHPANFVTGELLKRQGFDIRAVHRRTILSLTLWNTSVGTSMLGEKAWAINYRAKGPTEWEAY